MEKEREELDWNSRREAKVAARDRRKWRLLLHGLMRSPGRGEEK